MKLYSSNLTDSILSKCDIFWDAILIESIKWNKVSWNDYKNLALSYAQKLLENGIKQGDSIVIFVKDITKFSYIALGVLLVWGKLIIIESDYSEQILKEKLKFIQPDLVIMEGFLYKLLHIPFIKKLHRIKKFRPLIRYSKKVISESWKNYVQKWNNEEYLLTKIDSDTESLVVFTWWTTWKPKWVVHTLWTLEVMFQRIWKVVWDDTKIFYAYLPHFVLMWVNMWVKVIAWENNISDSKFLDTLKTYSIDTTFSPPYRYINFAQHKKKLPKTLKHILLWSAPIYISFLEKIYKVIDKDTKVTCIYWMTEILPISYIDGREKIEKTVDGDNLWNILDGIIINILEDWEWVVSWKGLMMKYLWWEKIEKHKTWDLLIFEGDYLIMKWRKKDMILRKDYNIYPSLYEPIINSIPWVVESALVGVFDKSEEDEKIILFLEVQNRVYTENKYFKYLKTWKYAIDTFALPDEIIFCTLPRKWRQNKIDKQYLRNNYKKQWK